MNQLIFKNIMLSRFHSLYELILFNIIWHVAKWRLAQWVEWASHAQRLCPRCSGPGFEPWPGALCCVSLPLALNLFPVISFSCSFNKAWKPKNIYFKKECLCLVGCWLGNWSLMQAPCQVNPALPLTTVAQQTYEKKLLPTRTIKVFLK